MSSRTCAKPSCSVSASTTLTYDYSGQTVWIEPLNAEAHPMRYDLCADHTNALKVPRGWVLKDLRAAVPHAIASWQRAVKERRWGLGDVLAGFALALVGSQVVLSIILAVTHRTADQVDDLPLSLVAISQMGLWAGLLGVPVLATRLKGNGVIADLHLRVRWADLWQGGVVGVVLQVLVLPLLYWPLLHLLGKHPSDLEGPAKHLTDRANGPVGVILLVLIVGVGAPIIEEIFYRGFCQGALRKRGASAAVTIGITAVVFGLSHGELLQLPALILFGAVAGTLAHRTGRLGPGIAAHVAFNMVTVVALLTG